MTVAGQDPGPEEGAPAEDAPKGTADIGYCQTPSDGPGVLPPQRALTCPVARLPDNSQTVNKQLIHSSSDKVQSQRDIQTVQRPRPRRRTRQTCPGLREEQGVPNMYCAHCEARMCHSQQDVAWTRSAELKPPLTAKPPLPRPRTDCITEAAKIMSLQNLSPKDSNPGARAKQDPEEELILAAWQHMFTVLQTHTLAEESRSPGPAQSFLARQRRSTLSPRPKCKP